MVDTAEVDVLVIAVMPESTLLDLARLTDAGDAVLLLSFASAAAGAGVLLFSALTLEVAGGSALALASAAGAGLLDLAGLAAGVAGAGIAAPAGGVLTMLHHCLSIA